MKLVVFTDGASRGNPGPASFGLTVSDTSGKILLEVGEYIGKTTNNVAEYTAVLKALQKIKEKFSLVGDIEISFFADSKLVVEQLSGRFKIKSLHLKQIYDEIRLIAQEFKIVTFTHVPRAKNAEADRLANKALDSL